jgi:mono/diheme cytochrome c family protein
VVAPGQPLPGAIGLYVPGSGSTMSRAGAIASLERGKIENALLGGRPGGKVVADLVSGPGHAPAVYVQLPRPGSHPNTRRYLVSVDAPGFVGILTSGSTHIDGLVSMTDITQTAVALATQGKPAIRAVRGTRADLMALDRRLAEVHRARGWTMFALILTYAGLIAFAPGAAVLAPASAITGSLVLSALDATQLWVVIAGSVGFTIALALGAAARRRLIPAVVFVFLVGYLIALAASPKTNALAVLGARPDGGGRFYGLGNQLETLLLAPAIAAVAVGGLPWLLPIGALSLVTVGWSKAGADGGGLVVFAAAFAILVARLRPGPLSWRRLALVGACAIAVVFALIGIDAALGGSSHVTHSVGSGSLFGDFWRRLHLSWASVTRAWYSAALFLGCAGVLVLVAVRRPRYASVDAILVAIVVSLLVNDTPVDVILLGTLGCLALLRFESVDSRPMRAAALIAVCAAGALALAGCGSQGVKTASPSTVVGTVQKEPPGKAIFAAQGCGSCHTFTPAGPDAKGSIGPNLDNLAQYAKQAKQPLKQFVATSIAHPEAYIQPGYPKNVMPKTYGALPAQDLKDLVDFLTSPQG